MRNLAPDLLPAPQAHPQTYVSTAPILRTHYVALDMREAPCNQKKVRQAATYAIDRQAIVENLMGGLGRVLPTVVNPVAFGYDASVAGSRDDPKQARALQQQAGFPTGVDLTLHAGVSEAFFRQIAEALAERLTEGGLRTKVKRWDPGPAWNTFLQGEGKASNGYYGTWGYYATFDADAILHPLSHTEGGGLGREMVYTCPRPGYADRRRALHAG